MQTAIEPDADCNAAPFIVELMRGLVGCLADRPDISDERQNFHARALAFCVRAFQPRDMLELAAAQHCLTAHHSYNDVAYDVLHERDRPLRDKMRPQVNAAGRIYLTCRREFERLRRRGPDELVVPFNGSVAGNGRPAGDAQVTGNGSPAGAAEGPAVPDQDQTEWELTGPPDLSGAHFMPAPDEMMAAVRELAARFAAAPAFGPDAGPAAVPTMPACAPSEPEPSAETQPMNRQQRRLAERQARKDARRSVRPVTRAPSAAGR